MEQVADRNERRSSLHPLLPADIHGELGLEVGVGRPSRRLRPTGRQASALQRDQAPPLHLEHARHHRLDPRRAVHRNRDHREVLGQGEEAVGVKVMPEAKTLRSAEQDAHHQAVTAVEVEQRVGDQAIGTSVALAKYVVNLMQRQSQVQPDGSARRRHHPGDQTAERVADDRLNVALLPQTVCLATVQDSAGSRPPRADRLFCANGAYGSTRPRRMAYLVSSTRSCIPSFSRMLARWRSTVFSLITSAPAISRVL